MKTLRTKAELREALAPERRAGRRIGLVPTMGSFHEGHLSLMRRARAECDVVVVSLFVNPTQFGPGEDLEAYPRDEARDAELAAAEGVDVLWAPSAEEMYPDGPGAFVEVDAELTGVLDGDPDQRGPGHFRGVTTIVAKLFNCVQPDVAYFGRKDAQQALVIERMARDLDFPVEIAVAPTVREADGLAMSSRNSYLDGRERERAAALSRGLRAAERAAAAGERSADTLVAAVADRASRGRHRAGVRGGSRRREPRARQRAQRPAGAGRGRCPDRQGAPDRQRRPRGRPRRTRNGGLMSTRPRKPTPAENPAHPVSDRVPVTLPRIEEMKRNGEPIVMVTAYDFPSAQVAEEAGVDVVLVGDSAAMVVLGHEATTPVGMDEMLMLTKAVRRGLKTPLLVGDMPFGSYERSNEQAIENAHRFVKEAGVAAVKLERGGPSVDRARAIIRAGVPVMGHVGLTPQTATQLGGFKAQGRTAEAAAKLAEDTLALQSVGCFAVVFEAIPAAVSEALMERVEVPVIGIGAGPATDGQVLVFHDLLGMYEGQQPRFVRRYADIRREMVAAVRAYADDVRNGRFPDEEHSYSIAPEELAEFRRYLEEESLAGTNTPWDW